MTEDDIQATVIDGLRKAGARGLVAWHPKNGGVHQAGKWQRVKNARLGVLAGVADVHILHAGKLYCLELKTEHGKESEAQRSVRRIMLEAGAVCGIAHGIDDALTWLAGHGLLRGAV